MFLTPSIVGKTFSTDIDSNTVWTVQGFADGTGTIVLIATTWDQASNRTRIASFKLEVVKFKGDQFKP
jgi:hypothetical protein